MISLLNSILPIFLLGLSESIASLTLVEKFYSTQKFNILRVVIISLPVLVLLTWWAAFGNLGDIFLQLDTWQKLPPPWLQTPHLGNLNFFLPTLLMLATVWLIMGASPQPINYSKLGIIGILLLVTGRYLLWRTLCTLSFDNFLNGFVSVGLLVLELFLLFNNTIQLFLLVLFPSKQREVDKLNEAVASGKYQPSVDILIPTYNEPEFILRRTIIGCKSLNYRHKKIYLLDDGRRESMRQLALELGCYYITRSNNSHAKAGNINHALPRTSGELIVVFDADFVPNRNFLQRTVGFFQDRKVALVQTPQSFYNIDPIARNLGLGNRITSEEELFYRHIQPIRDAAGSLVCCGTSFVMRRSALLEVGGFCTESITEDYYTGVRLSASGYELVYLNEKLSAGLAAENIAGYITQRLRWCRGCLQGLFLDSNPLTIPGLKPLQRLAHLDGLLYWFTCFSRIGFLLVPLAYGILGAIPLRANAEGILYFFIPYYLVSIFIFTWLNRQSRNFFLSDVYAVLLCFPLALTIIQTIRAPFEKGFKVTPKGIESNCFNFNCKLAMPLLILFGATTVSLLWSIRNYLLAPHLVPIIDIGLGWTWSVYNLIVIGISILMLIDAPNYDSEPWFDLRETVKVAIAGKTFWGRTTMISLSGAKVKFNCSLPNYGDEEVDLKMVIHKKNLPLCGKLISVNQKDDSTLAQIKFSLSDIGIQWRLIELLYCRPGQWKYPKTPTEIRMIWLLLKSLFVPKFLFDKHYQPNFLEVSQPQISPPN